MKQNVASLNIGWNHRCWIRSTKSSTIHTFKRTLKQWWKSMVNLFHFLNRPGLNIFFALVRWNVRPRRSIDNCNFSVSAHFSDFSISMTFQLSLIFLFLLSRRRSYSWLRWSSDSDIRSSFRWFAGAFWNWFADHRKEFICLHLWCWSKWKNATSNLWLLLSHP